MSRDDRDILDVLRTELDFIEKGGYGRSVRTPWKPTSVFEDSLSCPNYADPTHSVPCSACMLMNLVPLESRAGETPCHHVVLNEKGETLEEIELRGDQQEIEEAVKSWLRLTIKRIEKERELSSAV
ncbi:MAG TPA: hypothetical protein VJQ56_13650 [Blastocatellia bacterium]|nr:hypothetical protein [Blastocatellia bacterium]